MSDTSEIPVISGDIIKTNAPYIMQQCNSVTVNSAGLAKHLGDNLVNGNVYKNRRRIGRSNLADESDRDVPGTFKMFKEVDGEPSIICLYGQYKPGKPNKKPPTDFSDSKLDRARYFKKSLEKLQDYFKTNNEYPEVAVPYGIGCGLAGGEWKTYKVMLNNFNTFLRENGGGLVMYKL